MADESTGSLPPTKQFITSIISELASYHPATTSAAATAANLTPYKNAVGSSSGTVPAQNLLSKLTETELSKVKPLLLTLHCLFPNEFLLALDILDRKLVSKLVVTTDNGQKKIDDLLFVRSISSSSSPTSRWRRRHWQKQSHEPPVDSQFYEVRLGAWNCSCPAFTLASFRDMSRDGDNTASGIPIVGDNYHLTHGQWIFGDGDGGCTVDARRRVINQLRDISGDDGMKAGEDDPAIVCKHLLACVLGTRCPGLFGGGVEEFSSNVKEAAGWCAGW